MNKSPVKKTLPEQVLESPEAFDLGQLIYIIESIRTNINPLGEDSNPAREAVRIRSKFTMHQEGTEIDRIVVKNTLSGLPEVYINTLSIGGVNGPLPTPYTEILLDQIKEIKIAINSSQTSKNFTCDEIQEGFLIFFERFWFEDELSTMTKKNSRKLSRHIKDKLRDANG